MVTALLSCFRGRWGFTIGLAFVLAFVAASSVGLVWGQPDWPTPPPAPPAPAPRLAAFSEIVRVPAPFVPGASATVILPLTAPSVPLIPPLPVSEVRTSDGVRLISEAGTLAEIVQLVYEPLPIGEIKQPDHRLKLLQAFQIRSYDFRAKEIIPVLRRPWVLEVPVPLVVGMPVDAKRLLMAREESGRGWVPLVTTYHSDRQIVEVRVLGPGRYALLLDSLVALR